MLMTAIKMSPCICLFILTSLQESICEAAIVPTGDRAQGSLSYGQINDRPRSLVASRLCIEQMVMMRIAGGFPLQ